jgi:ribosome-associated translation inhibitor RaiA
MAQDPTIIVTGIARYRALAARVNRELTAALTARRMRPTSVRADFADEDGPTRAAALRCGLTVHVARRAPIHVEHVAETPHRAFELALGALERALERERERARDGRRRPKKYYAAKLLGGPAGTERAARRG